MWENNYDLVQAASIFSISFLGIIDVYKSFML